MAVTNDKKRILWVDDEIDGLRSHILFLEQRGYAVETAPNGEDALELVERGDVDKATALEFAPDPEKLKMAFKGIKVAAPGIL